MFKEDFLLLPNYFSTNFTVRCILLLYIQHLKPKIARLESCLELLGRLAGAVAQASEGGLDVTDGPGREMLYQEILVSCSVTEEDVRSLRQLKDSDISVWRKAVESGISLASVSTALHAHMTAGPNFAARLTATSVYIALLAAPGCPAASLIDDRAWQAILRTIRQAAAPSGAAAAADPDEEMLEEDDVEGGGPQEDPSVAAARLLPSVLGDLRTALACSLALHESPEMLKLIVETLALLASATENARVLPAVYAVLAALWAPRHGDARTSCTAVFHAISTAVLIAPMGPPHVKGAKRGARARAIDTIRRAAIEFAAESARSEPRSREAVAAMMRHLSLKCCAKAELRSVALAAITALLPALPVDDRTKFVHFIIKLSKTATATHRLLSVELASEIVLHFEGAFEEVQHKTDLAAAAAAPAAAMAMPEDPLDLGPVPLPSPGSIKKALSTPTEAAAAAVPGSGSEKWPSPPGTPLGCPFSVGILCLHTLLQRCSDKAPNVRAKALAVLGLVVGEMARTVDADVTFTALQQLRQLQLDTAAAADASPGVDRSKPSTGEHQRQRIDFDGLLGRPAEQSALEGLGSLLRLARRRAGDEKGVVRKAALLLLESALQLARTLHSKFTGALQLQLAQGPTQEDVEVMAGASMDVLVTVRRAALASLVSALRAFPTHAHLPAALVRACGNLVRDSEASVHDHVAATLADVLLCPVASAAKRTPLATAAADAREPLETAARLLAALGDTPPASSTLLAKYLPMIAHKKLASLKGAAAGALTFAADLTLPAAARIGAWTLIAEIAALDPTALDCTAVQAQWENMARCSAAATAPRLGGAPDPAACPAFWSRAAAPLLRTIAALSGVLPAAVSEGMAETLFQALKGLTLPPAIVGAYAGALAKLAPAARARARLSLATWTQATLEACEEALTAYVAFLRKGESAATAAATHAHETDFSFLNPGAHAPATAAHATTSAEALLADERSGRALCALFTVGEVALLGAAQPSGRLLTLTQALTVDTLATDVAGAALRGSGTVHVPPLLQAYAWTAVGKIGLVHEPLAKRLVPLLVQELGASPHPAVRNNLLVVLADLCVTYTALVDAHMPRLTGCMRDPCALVRKQALALLARLLSTDYVKCRGPLFHQLILALTDAAPDVAEVAEYVLRETLATRIPLLAYNHFSEAVFILNKCQPSGIEAEAQPETASQPTSLSQFESSGGSYPLAGADPGKREGRRKLYGTLLRFMTQEHRLATAAKLSGNILARVAEGSFPLDAAGSEEVFSDALWLLTCTEIRTVLVPSGPAAAAAATAKGAAGAGPEEDLEAEAALAGAVGAGNADVLAAEAAAKVRGKILSELAKKQLQDGVVPVLRVLRSRLLELRHARLRDVMATFAALLREYRGDLQDLLPNDRTLVKELQALLLQRPEGTKGAVTTAKRGRPATLRLPAEGVQVQLQRRARGPLPAGTSPDTPLAAEVLRESQRGGNQAARAFGRGTGEKGGPGVAKTPAPALATTVRKAKGGPNAPTPKVLFTAGGATTAKKEGAGRRQKSRTHQENV